MRGSVAHFTTLPLTAFGRISAASEKNVATEFSVKLD